MTKRNFTYRQKYILLLVIGLIVSIIIYKASIQPSLRAGRECKKMAVQLESVSQAPQAIKRLETEIKQLDQLFGNNEIKDKDVRSQIINKCSNYCKSQKIKIAQIKEPNIQLNDDLIIETTEIHFEGQYKPLMNLIYHLETTALNGKLASVNFQKEIDKRSKEERLILQVFIQSITKTKN